MIAGIRQKALVGEGGKIEVLSPELPSGTLVEVIILIEPVEQDTTEYLLFHRSQSKSPAPSLARPGRSIQVYLRQPGRPMRRIAFLPAAF